MNPEAAPGFNLLHPFRSRRGQKPHEQAILATGVDPRSKVIEKPDVKPDIETKSPKKPGKKWALGLAGLTVVGSGIAVGPKLLKHDAEPIPSPTPTLSESSEPVTSLSERQKELQEVQRNVNEFFSLSRSEFEKWAKTNVFGAREGGPWTLPRWEGHTEFVNTGNGKTKAIYDSGITINSPHLSIATIYGELQEYGLIGVNLGVVQVPTKSKGEVSVLLLGVIPPREFQKGREVRLVYPFFININDPDPALRGGDQFYQSLISHPRMVYTTKDGFHNAYFTDSYSKSGEFMENRELLFKLLKSNQGKVLEVGVDKDGPFEDNFKKNANVDISKTVPIFGDFELLMQKKKDLFYKRLEDHKRKGLVLTSSSDRFPWINGVNNWRDIFNYTTYGSLTVFKDYDTSDPSFNTIQPLIK